MKVVLGASHALLREGLRELLKRWDGIEVVGVAPAPDDAARLAAQGEADVLLLVRGASSRDDARAISALRLRRTRCRVILIEATGGSAPRDDLGADLRLGPGIGIHGLVQALCQACGESPSGGDGAASGEGASDPEPQLLLTSRETDVVRAVCAGLPNKSIAKQLGISEKTVKNHLSSIYGRVGLDGRTQLAVWAMGRDLAVGKLSNPLPSGAPSRSSTRRSSSA